jgi:hypothetical protein
MPGKPVVLDLEINLPVPEADGVEAVFADCRSTPSNLFQKGYSAPI